jgi:hypothetical protein
VKNVAALEYPTNNTKQEAKWIDQNLPRNSPVKHVEGKIVGGTEVMGRQGGRRK